MFIFHVSTIGPSSTWGKTEYSRFCSNWFSSWKGYFLLLVLGGRSPQMSETNTAKHIQGVLYHPEAVNGNPENTGALLPSQEVYRAQIFGPRQTYGPPVYRRWAAILFAANGAIRVYVPSIIRYCCLTLARLERLHSDMFSQFDLFRIKIGYLIRVGSLPREESGMMRINMMYLPFHNFFWLIGGYMSRAIALGRKLERDLQGLQVWFMFHLMVPIVYSTLRPESLAALMDITS